MSLLAPFLLATIISSGTPPSTTGVAKASAAAEAVAAAYAKVDAAQARLPAPTSDREKLLRLQARDQAGREVLATIDLSALSDSERTAALAAMSREILAQDLEAQAELKRLRPKCGWFPISTFGRDGALAAWLVVQHATNDPDLMRATVTALDHLRRMGEAQPTAYAIMYDRVALMFDHKPQRYGTQLECHAGHLLAQNVEDQKQLNARRRGIGFPQTEAAYIKEMDDGYCRRMGK